MSFILPLTALALVVLARFAFGLTASGEPDGTPARIPSGRYFALALLLILAAATASRFGTKGDVVGLEIGAVVGAAVALIGAWAGNGVSAFAAGVTGAASLHMLSKPAVAPAQLALVVGAALAALALSTEGAAAVACAAAFCVAGDDLVGRHSDAASAAVLGSVLGLSAVAGAIVASRISVRLAVLKPVAIGLVILIGAEYALQSMSERGMLPTIAIGVGAAIAIHWTLGELTGSDDGGRIALGAVIAIGVGTVGFGLERGAGMACALVAAGGLLICLGNRFGSLVLGPLFGLVLFRVLREAHPDVSRALDIGQHYTMLGVVLGAVLPLMPSDWLKREAWRGALGAFLWGVLLFALPVILVLGWPTGIPDLTRDDKLKLFVGIGAALVVVAGLLGLVSRSDNRRDGRRPKGLELQGSAK
jgi:hypothetical protein